MTTDNEYKLAVALLRFKKAYAEMVEASVANPEYDMSTLYPFYLLDHEKIAPAVEQWCTWHAAQLMKNLPDKVDNPACYKCHHFREGLGADGQCKGIHDTWCGVYPIVQFSRAITSPFMSVMGIDISKLTDNDVHLLYMQRMDEIYEEKKMRGQSDNSTADLGNGSADV